MAGIGGYNVNSGKPGMEMKRDSKKPSLSQFMNQRGFSNRADLYEGNLAGRSGTSAAAPVQNQAMMQVMPELPEQVVPMSKSPPLMGGTPEMSTPLVYELDPEIDIYPTQMQPMGRGVMPPAAAMPTDAKPVKTDIRNSKAKTKVAPRNAAGASAGPRAGLDNYLAQLRTKKV